MYSTLTQFWFSLHSLRFFWWEWLIRFWSFLFANHLYTSFKIFLTDFEIFACLLSASFLPFKSGFELVLPYWAFHDFWILGIYVLLLWFSVISVDFLKERCYFQHLSDDCCLITSGVWAFCVLCLRVWAFVCCVLRRMLKIKTGGRIAFCYVSRFISLVSVSQQIHCLNVYSWQYFKLVTLMLVLL